MLPLPPSKKTFSNAYCATPDMTIERIRDGFARHGLAIEYTPSATRPGPFGKLEVAVPVLGTYSGHAHIKGAPPQFGTNGKGMSPKLAQAGAMAELVERYSLGILHSYYSWLAVDRHIVSPEVHEFFADVKFLPGYVRGHRRDVRGAVDVDAALALGGVSRKAIAAVWDRPIAQHWVDGYSLLGRRKVKVPLAFITRMTGSNGLAAGNTLAEALCHGVCEVFERFCTWEVVLGRLPCPTVRRDTIDDPEILAVLEEFEKAGIRVTIKDLSLGGRFPVIGTVFRNENMDELTGPSARPRKDHFYRTLRAGSAPHRKDALLRCFTEELQGQVLHEYLYRESAAPLWEYWIDKMGRTYTPRDDEWMMRSGLDRRDFNRHGNVAFLEEGPEVSWRSLWDWRHGDCRDDLDEAIKICRREKADLLAVDVTHPEIRFPAVAVFVPRFMNRSNMFEAIKDMLEGRRDSEIPPQRLDAEYFEDHDDWVEQPEMIDRLIDTVEDYLSTFFPVCQWNSRRAFDPVNLCQLLAFAYLDRGRYRDACHALELWRITGPTPGAQKVAAEVRDWVARNLLKGRPSKAKLKAYLRSLPLEGRHFVAEPRLNPFNAPWDSHDPHPFEVRSLHMLKMLFDRFHASFAAPPGRKRSKAAT